MDKNNILFSELYVYFAYEENVIDAGYNSLLRTAVQFCFSVVVDSVPLKGRI